MKNKKNFFKGKGFYMSLGLLVLAAVVASGVAINGMVGKLETQNPSAESGGTTWQQGTQEANKPQSKVPVLPASPSPSPKAPSSSSSSTKQSGTGAATGNGAAAQTSTFVLPVAGQVTAVYSGDELVYNETLGDWRTHNGMDITANTGAEVKAAMAGTVSAVKEDPMWGTVVEVQCDAGTLRYCGLAADVKVKEGTLLKQGDLLGTLGEIPAETALEPHLHFELLKDGALVDPETLMK